MIYGVDFGGRRVAIAGPDLLRAALVLEPPRRAGEYRRTVAREVGLLAGFLAAVVPPEATIWMEYPVARHGPRMNVGTAIRLGMTVGALFAVHAGPGYTIDQAVWKANTVGSGSANKDEIAAWLWDQEPAEAEACGGDQDLVDAAVIRAYGVMVAEGRVEEPWKLP